MKTREGQLRIEDAEDKAIGKFQRPGDAALHAGNAAVTDKDDRLLRSYQEEVGREPRNLPIDHPYLWQWEYRGIPAEREMLEEMLNPYPEEVYDQEELF